MLTDTWTTLHQAAVGKKPQLAEIRVTQGLVSDINGR